MLIILWIVTIASLSVSLVSLVLLRRSAKRVDQLSQLYWELRYQQGELRAHIQATGGMAKPQEAPSQLQRPAPDAFVPLSAIKR